MKKYLDDSICLGFVGDIALSGEFLAAAKPKGNSLNFPFANINRYLNDIDIFFLNLEGPIGCDGSPRKKVTSHIYNEPIIIEWLKRFPLCICNIANNHVMDYGAEALIKTKNILKKNGIYCVGAGLNYEEASSPLIVNCKGHKFGFLGLTTNEEHVGSVLADEESPGCFGIKNNNAFFKEVSTVSRNVDYLIISMHWGHEYFNYPSPDQIQLGRLLVKLGANIVVGHHPHVIQGSEKYMDGLIVYSLGNLLLPEMRSLNGRIQYRKPITKQYSILKIEFEKKKLLSWNLVGGMCTKKYELVPYEGYKYEQFKCFTNEISSNLLKSNYNLFWKNYKRKRFQELEKEEINDAIRKMLISDLRTIISTFTIKDLKRNLNRIIKYFKAARE